MLLQEIMQGNSLYSLPSFPQWKQFAKLDYNIKMRILTLIQSTDLPQFYLFSFVCVPVSP